jgi:hypothetical protein
MKQTGDLGLVRPETRLVREKLWPPDGTQPKTAQPQATVKDGLLTITCATEGASIGFRREGEPSWTVYTVPSRIDAAGRYEIVAHRIGFKPSAVVAAAAD